MKKLFTAFVLVVLVFAAGCSVIKNPSSGDAVVIFTNSEVENLVRDYLGIHSGDILTSDIENITYIYSEDYQGSLEGIEILRNLTEVHFYENSDIRDVTPLSKLRKLRSITLNRNTNLENLDSLAGLPFLEYLSLKRCGLTSVQFLRKFKGLKQLYINDNDIKSLDGIEGVTSLEELYIGRNQISSLAPLANLSRLNQLRAGNNNISGVSVLLGISGFKSGDGKSSGYICLYSNPLSDDDLNKTIPRLERAGVNVGYDSGGLPF